MPHATRPGDLLGDRYRLVDLLTESGSGRFWRAYDRILERHVAIHVIAAGDERASALMDAARRSATVHDRRMLRVLDAEIGEKLCFVVNEWGWGSSLDVIVASIGTLRSRHAAWLVAEVADSIAAAHEAGIAHGQLNPENVLIDRNGAVRIIGLSVDAALHGVETEGESGQSAAMQRDVEDLGGLLYYALTAKWAGASRSGATAAPRGGGDVLRPRQVRAGIPRPLDNICDDVLVPERPRHRETADVEISARGIEGFLSSFVGDATGISEALLASLPDVPADEEQVVLPPVPELRPFLADEPPELAEVPGAEPGARRAQGDTKTSTSIRTDTDTETDTQTETGQGAGGDNSDDELPTEAGVPIFGEGDDVSWLERRSTPAAPPPPFDDPPERPLFAPTPADGEPIRKPRNGVASGSHGSGPKGAGSKSGGSKSGDEYWPWETGGPVGLVSTGTHLATVEEEPVPGRSFLRLAIIIAVVCVVGLGVMVAVNLGNGRGPLGREPESSTSRSNSPSAQRSPGPAPALTGLVATAFDPLGGSDGNGAENDPDAKLAVDGDAATSWSTVGYNDQLGPAAPALKTGVGLVIDLGAKRSVTAVDLTFVGAPTSVSLYVTDAAPTEAPEADGLKPVAQGTADGTKLRLPVDGATGTHLIVWLTSLPEGDDGRFRGRVAEVVVHGE